MPDLAGRTKTVVCSDAAAAGTTTITPSAAVDMSGFRGVMFIAFLGDVTATCVPHLKALQGDASDGSDGVAISGTSALSAAGASNYDVKTMVLDVYRPLKRYITPQLVRGTANAVLNGIIAILYDPINEPTSADSSNISNVVLADPA